MKKFFSLLLVCVLSFCCLTGCGSKTSSTGSTGSTQPEQSSYEKELMSSEFASGLHHVEITMKDGGSIALELDADTAPLSVANFCVLAKDGFYDGLTFHRIMSGFMIQGGDPTGTGFEGSSNSITGEFEQNGIANDISHKRGAISMARSTSPNSASSQFFIVHEDSDFLDGSYAAFGQVTSGMEVVDKIAEHTPVEDKNGTVKRENQPVIESIVVID